MNDGDVAIYRIIVIFLLLVLVVWVGRVADDISQIRYSLHHPNPVQVVPASSTTVP